MRVLRVNPDNPEPEVIRAAAETLKGSGLVIYPTDTAYGLGANALDKAAVRKMYEAKGRDFSKPTHIVAQNWEMIEQLAQTNEFARKLHDAFLPGPLTIILKKKSVVPDLLTAGRPTIGVRIPNSPVTRGLSEAVNFPYTTPSANLSGKSAPYSAEEAINQIGKDVDLILDAGELAHIPPSTLVDLSQEPPKILRPGPVTKRQIEEVLGSEVEASV